MMGRPIAPLFPETHIREEQDLLTRLERGESVGHHEAVLLEKPGD